MKIVNKIAEIDFDDVTAKAEAVTNISDLKFVSLPKDITYKPFSVYPFIVRDIALFVPENAKEGDVTAVLSDAAKEAAGALLVKGPDCFDRFSKAGKTSLAFRMIFQSFDRTLSDEEVNKYMAKVTETAVQKEWVVR